MGEKMFALNNYNGIHAILGGIDHPTVVRLKKVNKSISKPEREFLPEIRLLVESKDLYRKHVDNLSLVPCIPLVQIHVQLMTEVYGRNVNKMETERGINFQ